MSAVMAALRSRFELLARDSYGFKRSRRDNYVNAQIQRDWKWFRLGADVPASELQQPQNATLAPAWQRIESAPKSKADGTHVHGLYLLGYCPEPDASNLESCICVVWWEPLMNKGRGMWYGEGGFEIHPTHWMHLPKIGKTGPVVSEPKLAFQGYMSEGGGFYGNVPLPASNPLDREAYARFRPVYLGDPIGIAGIQQIELARGIAPHVAGPAA